MTKKLCCILIIALFLTIFTGNAYANRENREILDSIYIKAMDAMDENDYAKSARALYDYIVAAPNDDSRKAEVYFQLGNIYRYAGLHGEAGCFCLTCKHFHSA